MAVNFSTDDILDLRDLAETAREASAILEDDEQDESEKEDAKETLEALASMLSDMGYSVEALEEDAVADELQSIGNNYECTLIAESHFQSYCEELCEDLGYLPKDLPAFLSNNINWSGVADDLKDDYNEVELDGETYFIRSF
ncbi:Hypothetical Protein OBI_RACECAR_306 [Arthrobacter phage Racecar]|nr:hypothetical protein PBI_RACECAR_98 [Arthrobacter phage Racecar]QFG12776.1 hypothetical protein PBI_MIMI_96 [Arthrobacter phage Mimi]